MPSMRRHLVLRPERRRTRVPGGTAETGTRRRAVKCRSSPPGATAVTANSSKGGRVPAVISRSSSVSRPRSSPPPRARAGGPSPQRISRKPSSAWLQRTPWAGAVGSSVRAPISAVRRALLGRDREASTPPYCHRWPRLRTPKCSPPSGRPRRAPVRGTARGSLPWSLPRRCASPRRPPGSPRCAAGARAPSRRRAPWPPGPRGGSTP